jgi:homoserine kinase type II
LLHLDYGPANIFMEDQQVTAVFDFEFAGIDLRVMELCVALSWWPVGLMGTGKEWEIMDALATAYVAGFPLREEELHAIPTVLRLRDVGSLVHRMGRYFAGMETDATMQKRAEHSLWRESWLVNHSTMLLHHAMAWR